jgi:hypothetical protein
VGGPAAVGGAAAGGAVSPPPAPNVTDWARAGSDERTLRRGKVKSTNARRARIGEVAKAMSL